MKEAILALSITFYLILFGSIVEASQVSHYQAAKKALAAKNYTTYKIQLDKMGDYILKPFVEYEYLQAHWVSLDNATIERFLNENEAAYVSKALRGRWLHRLVRQGDWQRFDEYYSDAVKDIELECYHLNRRIRSDGISGATDERIKEIWLTKRDRPDSCTSVFNQWHKAGKLTEELAWARIELAMKADRGHLARFISKNYLPAKQRIWVKRWLAVRAKPLRSLLKPSFPLDKPESVPIIIDGIEQIARGDPAGAENIWKKLVKQSSSLEMYAPDAYAVIGFRAVINHHPGGVKWMREASFEEERVRHWAMRAALKAGSWEDVLDFYKRMTDEEKSSPDWRYWQARALENLDKKNQAKDVYKQIANQREYYSFLAADKVATRYQMNDRPIGASTSELSRERAFKMAKELAAFEGPSMMRRQWDWAIHDLEGEKLLAAAKLAQKWGLHDRAIFTAGRAQYYDDVKLRFPILFEGIVDKQADAKQLPQAYVFAVMRQESAFMPDAKSPAGARGLMQIMPRTGRLIARQQKRGGYRRSQLMDPTINIDMGTFYLRSMLNRFNGNYAMATAAYNAGPGRSVQWQAYRELDADIWIENIPFKETRDYVKKVMMYEAIYQDRLGSKHEPISKQLLPVPAR